MDEDTIAAIQKLAQSDSPVRFYAKSMTPVKLLEIEQREQIIELARTQAIMLEIQQLIETGEFSHKKLP